VVGTGGSVLGPSLIYIDGGSGGIAISGTGNIGSSSGVVDLNSAGGITEDATATLNAGILQSSLGVSGNVSLPNAAVANIGDFAVTGGSFTLNDSIGLSVFGALTATKSATIVDVGTLTVSGTIGAPAIALTAGEIDIPGLVTDGGDGTVSLVANAGSINETGTLIVGTLTGSVTGGSGIANFSGATPTTNQIATLGNFTASGFTLDNNSSLSVNGTLAGGRSVAITDSSLLTVNGSIMANAVNLTAGNIAIPGFVSDGGEGTTSLIATAGTIGETGTLIAGTLSGSSIGVTNLTGETPTTNQVAALGNFGAAIFNLNDGISLTIGGSVNGGPLAGILDNGALTIGGTLAATNIGLSAFAWRSLARSATAAADRSACMRPPARSARPAR